jgi:integrase
MKPLAVGRLQHPGPPRQSNITYAVGGVAGLMLQITATGARSWILRTLVGTLRREIGLGSYPEISLGDARDKARTVKDSIKAGIDPIEQRKAARASLIVQQKRGLTFDDAVQKYLATKTAEFRNEKHKKQWRSTLDTYAAPAIGKMQVADIGVHDILRVLEPIWTTKTETASRLRGRIENVLAWATVKGHRTGDNPARWRGHLSETLPKPSKVGDRGNHPALALKDAATFFESLRKREGTAARALEFLMLTATRSGEVRGMCWSEYQADEQLWIIPAARMKAGKEHRIPLTKEAVALLKAMPKMQGSEFVFAAPRGGKLSDMSISAVMRRMQDQEEQKKHTGWIDPRSGRLAVPHGMRSVFRDWAAEHTEYPTEMAEIALAHTIANKVEAAYRRGDMIEKRRLMMSDWAAFLLEKSP